MSEDQFKYQYNCVSPKSLKELNHIIDNLTNITYETFRKHVNKDDFKMLKESLGYVPGSLPTWKQDWSITYHKSKTPKGKTVYIFCHSGIEYIFY
jgi:hypothetical protein